MKEQFGVDNCNGSWQGGPGWPQKAPTKWQTAHQALKAGPVPARAAGATGRSRGGQSAGARPGGQKKGRLERSGRARLHSGQTEALVLGLLGPGCLGRECSQPSFQKLKTAVLQRWAGARRLGDAVTQVREARLRGGEGRLSAQVGVTRPVGGAVTFQGRLRFFPIPGTISRHFPRISSVPRPHHPETRADNDTGS